MIYSKNSIRNFNKFGGDMTINIRIWESKFEVKDQGYWDRKNCFSWIFSSKVGRFTDDNLWSSAYSCWYRWKLHQRKGYFCDICLCIY